LKRSLFQDPEILSVLFDIRRAADRIAAVFSADIEKGGYRLKTQAFPSDHSRGLSPCSFLLAMIAKATRRKASSWGNSALKSSKV
jgi:hypothetical protein